MTHVKPGEVNLRAMNGRERLLKALQGEDLDRPPVWLMRQAGRYLPIYREVRKAHGFWDVCHDPELSTKVALEPLARFKLDAAIVFSDILIVPEAMGLGVTFGAGHGPQVARPLRTEADLAAWKTDGVQERLAFMPRAVRHLANALEGKTGLLGFAGAPFTLFAYCVEGGSSDDFAKARTLLHTNPALADKALATLADVTAQLLYAQLEAGADAVQIFDTWGGMLTREEYTRFCAPAIRRVTEALAPRRAPLLLFVKGGQHLLPVLGETGAQGFSLDWRVEWREARARYPKAILQGNIDPVLLQAGNDVVRAKVRRLISEMRADDAGRRCILNLGHGITPETPPEAVEALCDEVARHG